MHNQLVNDNLHTQTIEANFRGFPHCVHQTHAVDLVRMGLQAVISRSDNICVTLLMGKMTSLLVS